MPIPVIDPLPPAPVRNDPNFASVAEVWVQYLADTYTPQLNAAFPQLVNAAAAAGYSSHSTDTEVIGSGAKSFAVETGKMFVAGQYVIVADSNAPDTNFMWGQITAYNFGTGALEFNALAATGSGTHSAWLIGLSGPQGATGGSQLDSPAFTGTPFEQVYTITDGASVDIDPSNGSIQLWTLGASRTPTDSLADGQSVLLMIDDGAGYAIVWSSVAVTWKTDGGSAPTLLTSGYTPIVLWRLSGTVYGARIGDA